MRRSSMPSGTAGPLRIPSSLLPVDCRRRDDPVVCQAGGTRRRSHEAFSALSAEGRDHLRAGPAIELHGEVFHCNSADSRCSPAHCRVLPHCRSHLLMDPAPRPIDLDYRAARCLLGTHDAGAGAGNWRGLAREEREPGRLYRQPVFERHVWSSTKTWDPEGILSTLPAISTVMFGILAGRMLRSSRSPSEKTAWLFFSGNALMFLVV